MSEKKIVFFDLDDTIINLTKIHKEAIKSGFDKFQEIENCVEKYIIEYNQNKYAKPKELFETVLKNENIENSEGLSNKANDEYEKYIDSNLVNNINPEFYNSLEKLKENNFEIGVITQGKEEIQSNKMEIINLKEKINEDNIFVVESKDCETYKSIKEKYPRYECFSIGDREDGDVIEPRKAGFNIVRFRNPISKSYDIKALDDYPQFETLGECVNYIIENN